MKLNQLWLPMLFLVWITPLDNSAPSTQVPRSERRILYATRVDGIKEIFSVEPDGSDQRRLTRTPADDYRRGIYRGSGDPAWSPDGSLIAFTSVRGEGDRDSGIFVTNSQGGDQRLLWAGRYEGHLDWSPDGTTIAFSWWPKGQMGVCDIYLVDVHSGNLRQLTNMEGEERGPDWSPDGLKIVFPNWVLDTNQLYTINPDGTDLESVRDSAGGIVHGGSPRWSPDGGTLAFVSYSPTGEDQPDPEIFLLDNESLVIRQLTDCHRNRTTCHELSWSPDGTRLVFRSNYEADYEDPVGNLRASEIYVIDVESGDIQRLTENDSLDESPCWW